jgi:hypothetical protein
MMIHPDRPDVLRLKLRGLGWHVEEVVVFTEMKWSCAGLCVKAGRC